MVAAVSLLLVLIGLPLLAFWLGGRSFWSRLKPGREDDLYGDVVRRHGLTPAQMSRVQSAVVWGRALEHPRERAAAVDLAQGTIDRARLRATEHPRRRATLLALVGLWAVVVVCGLVFLAVQGRWSEVNWSSLVTWAVIGVVLVHQHRAVHRAIRLNSGEPAVPGTDS